MQTGPGFFSTMQIPMLAGPRDRRARSAPHRCRSRSSAIYSRGPTSRTRIRLGAALHASAAACRCEVEIIGVSAPAHYGPVKFASRRCSTCRTPKLPPGVAAADDVCAEDRRRSVAPRSNTVRQIVHNADSRVPVTNFKTQAANIASTINQEILLAASAAHFAILALVIACAGLYGTMSYARGAADPRDRHPHRDRRTARRRDLDGDARGVVLTALGLG